MTKACVVFDISHKFLKTVVFDQSFQILFVESIEKPTTTDEDGHSCEDLLSITKWVSSTIDGFKNSADFEVIAVNFTSYAGTLVHVNQEGEPVLPVYDHARKIPYKTRKTFLEKYGQPDLEFRLQVPEWGLENSALQLYWIKTTKTEAFKKIKYSIPLTQYLQSKFTKAFKQELTMLGCHSGAWDFTQGSLHPWVAEENLFSYTLPFTDPGNTSPENGLAAGPGIYNKVACCLPLKKAQSEQFVLLSTGAWTVCINPFNSSLTPTSEFKHNCLSILDETGGVIKMSRLFSGDEHSRQIRHLANHFGVEEEFYLKVKFDRNIIRRLRKEFTQVTPAATETGGMMDCPFMERNINNFRSIEDAYHQFIIDLIAQQIASIKLTFDHQINRKIFVDGGLAKNEIFMELLSEAFHGKTVFTIGYEHTAALGAALAIADSWGADTSAIDAELLALSY